MASQFPCPESLSGCECLPFPVRNFSVEAPDRAVFFGHSNAPPVNGTFFAPTCLGVCESFVSQADADQCAAAAAVDCSLDGAPRIGNPTPHGAPPRRFRSSVQECAAECGDGNSTTVIEPLGTVISYTQADADARAHALACKRAQELLVCFVTASPLAPIHADQFASIPIIATGGNGDYEFTVVGGTLPTGMSFDPVGLLFGTPTGSGTSTFSVTVADSGGGTATKAFSIEILAACNMATDWCANPGTCRLRVKDFNAGGWTFAWLGTLPTKSTNFFFPCGGGYSDATGNVGLTFNDVSIYWQLSILCDDLTVYIATLNGASPLGLYVKDGGSDPLCGGPATFEIESYVP